MSEHVNRELLAALDGLVDEYLQNQGTTREFVACITPGRDIPWYWIRAKQAAAEARRVLGHETPEKPVEKKSGTVPSIPATGSYVPPELIVAWHEARRFYHADGTFEVFESITEVTKRRKQAAVDLKDLQGVSRDLVDFWERYGYLKCSGSAPFLVAVHDQIIPQLSTILKRLES